MVVEQLNMEGYLGEKISQDLDGVEDDVIADEVSCPFQNLEKGVDVAALAGTGRESVGRRQHA